ncbi:SUKH-4 family immunity protein [Streptomyces sp. NBC_01334]|uniref:SUKH-4 family immunity protein n=1 Tax=Streptomyces sp. NBC_01334 TaxID=2903827 RepID=UPI002E159FC3|nr:SUKH-4 family immunity protein [Streptomyces sp. NBC_01334]
MVTFAQAQERAEEWINGDVPAYQHREVRVREFELGFVVWAEDRAEGPRSDGGAQRLVIARDSGEATLWPSVPVGEVIRRYEEEYGRTDAPADAVPAPAARVDLNQTSFLLSPPEWLQEAADKLGIADRREAGSGAGSGSAAGSGNGEAASAPGSGVRAGAGAGSGSGSSGVAPGGDPSLPRTQGGVSGSGLPETQAGVPAGPGSGGSSAPAAPVGATPWAGTDTNADAGDDRSVSLPATVFAPPLSGSDDETSPPTSAPDAKTALISGGSQLPRTAVAPALDAPGAGGTGPGGAGAAGNTPGSSTSPAPPTSPTPPTAPAPPTPPSGPAGAAGSSYGYPQGPGEGAPGGPGAPSSSPGSSAGASLSSSSAAGPGTPPPAGPGTPARPLAPNAGDIADAATSKAAPPPRRQRGGGAQPPPPPGAPGTPGARPGNTPPPPPSGPGAPGTPAGGYVPTQLVSSLGPDGSAGPGGPGGPGAGQGAGGAPQPPGVPGAPSAPAGPNPPGGTPPGGVHHAATMLADPGRMGPGAPQPPGVPGAPHAPGAPGAPGMPGAQAAPGAPGAPQAPGAPGFPGAPGTPGGPGVVHHAQTMLAGPHTGGPGAPPPPQAPGGPGFPGAAGAPAAPGFPGAPGMAPAPGTAPGAPQPPMPPGGPAPGQPPAYGYPQQQGLPTVGPGYQAVLRFRAQDGSEQQLIRRSAPGTPHPEWQIFHELRAMNVPPDQVLELHTELESCELPGAYCARMMREQWPQARITSIAPYGTDHASRQQGMQQLLAHQGELHQVADGPARPAPVRAPLPPVQAAPPLPPEAIGQELAAVFGPAVFRFEQAAVSRQGVPPVVAHTLVVAGLPADMGPFFWAQAQPGRPVPTLAELAAERGVQPASDAGSYLVMGSDFGKAICVQYGTANIVAVPVEAGPGGAPVPPQFVNTGLPEFARCLALLGRMWRLRFGLNQEQAGRWTVDFQAQLASLDPAALGSPESWWSVLLEQMWDGLL